MPSYIALDRVLCYRAYTAYSAYTAYIAYTAYTALKRAGGQKLKVSKLSSQRGFSASAGGMGAWDRSNPLDY